MTPRAPIEYSRVTPQPLARLGGKSTLGFSTVADSAAIGSFSDRAEQIFNVQNAHCLVGSDIVPARRPAPAMNTEQ
jgi:hypothetical protein